MLEGGITNEIAKWSEHDVSIMASWKSLRSELKKFLYAVSDAIDILVEHLSSMDLEEVTNKRAEAFTMGWRDPDFLFTGVCELQTKRKIENPQRFVHSKANMNPDAIEYDSKYHADMKGIYSLMLKDPRLSDDVMMALEELINYYEECQEKN